MSWRIVQHNSSSPMEEEREITRKGNDDVWQESRLIDVSRGRVWPLVGFVNLAHELKRNNIGEDVALKTVLRLKDENSCFQNDEKVLFEMGQDMMMDISFDFWLADDDSVKLGFQMYEALHFCPDHQDEGKRLSLFFESLLTNHSLGTVVAATFYNVEERQDSGIQDYTSMNMWHKYLYKELDSRFNFTLGPSVVAISTVEQLKEMRKHDPLYLEQYEECIDQTETTCGKMNLSGMTCVRNIRICFCSIYT